MFLKTYFFNVKSTKNSLKKNIMSKIGFGVTKCTCTCRNKIFNSS